MPPLMKNKSKPKLDPIAPRRIEGDALWFMRALLPNGTDERSAEAGDLLAIGVRMSEADRRRLVQIVG